MEERDLQVGRGKAWPAKMASQAVGVLGVRGAGKSNLGRVMAEELFASSIPFVVFDPIGNWYGLRAGRDGRPGGGIPVPIFGGAHGDLPLDRTSGKKIADLIIDRRLSCVLDLSHEDFSETDKRRFLVDFGDRLFRRKARESGWLTLIMEEADDYAPQTTSQGRAGSGSTGECLGMFQRLVKRGRFKGLGAFLITQRSAAINKDLLYMVGTLVAFRTTGPRDQDAVGGWVKYNAVSGAVLESLPTLDDGEAWVISPEALGSIEKTKFRRMATYDTGATPEHGGQAKPATLADINVPALSKELADAMERAKAEDPRELRAEVARLRAALAKAESTIHVTKAVERAVLKEPEIKRMEAMAATVDASAKKLTDMTLALLSKLKPAEQERRIQGFSNAARALSAAPAPTARRLAPVARRATTSDGPLPIGESAVLTAAAQYERGVHRDQLSVLTGYKRSSRDAYIARLAARGFIDQAGGAIVATEEGRAALGPDFRPLPVGEELLEHWLNRLPEGEKRVLQVLVKAYPQPVERGTIDETVGYQRSSRDAYLQRLRSRRLVVDAGRGRVRASDDLFGAA